MKRLPGPSERVVRCPASRCSLGPGWNGSPDGPEGPRLGPARAPPDDRDREIAVLRRELVATREQQQSTIEQHDATTEELRSANEEVLSSNEELQSTNEELETAKEELQSINEELTTRQRSASEPERGVEPAQRRPGQLPGQRQRADRRRGHRPPHPAIHAGGGEAPEPAVHRRRP